MLRSRLVHPDRLSVIVVGSLIAAVALAVRWPFLPYQSGDYSSFVGQWYSYLASHGGFLGVGHTSANYNAPYLYLIAFLTYLPIPAIDAVKFLSIVFDFALAYLAMRIVALRHENGWIRLLAGAIVLLLPTVVLNSAMWGQADAIYSAFGLAGMYFSLRRRPWLACVFFGLAFAFKLQAVFLFPLLLLLLLCRRIPWPALLVIPGVYLLCDLPAFLLGASPSALLGVYVTQTNTYQELTLNAPNLYQLLGGIGDTELVRDLGIAVTGILVAGLAIVGAIRTRFTLSSRQIVLASAVSVTLVPYLLPAMHERYFYLADSLTVIAAFWMPRTLWFLPPLEQFASALSYVPFLSMGAGGPAGGGGRPSTGKALGGRGGGSSAHLPSGAPSGGGAPAGPSKGAGPGGHGFGGGAPGQHVSGAAAGIPSTTWVPFPVLSLAMLAVTVSLLVAAIMAFRRPDPAAPA